MSLNAVYRKMSILDYQKAVISFFWVEVQLSAGKTFDGRMLRLWRKRRVSDEKICKLYNGSILFFIGKIKGSLNAPQARFLSFEIPWHYELFEIKKRILRRRRNFFISIHKIRINLQNLGYGERPPFPLPSHRTWKPIFEYLFYASNAERNQKNYRS